MEDSLDLESDEYPIIVGCGNETGKKLSRENDVGGGGAGGGSKPLYIL